MNLQRNQIKIKQTENTMKRNTRILRLKLLALALLAVSMLAYPPYGSLSAGATSPGSVNSLTLNPSAQAGTWDKELGVFHPFAAPYSGRHVDRVIARTSSSCDCTNPVVPLNILANQFPYVTVYVTVLDANGYAITNLTQSAFSVCEESSTERSATTETITNFSREISEGGISVALVMDRSGSMSESDSGGLSKMTEAQAAADSFITNATPMDRGSLVTVDSCGSDQLLRASDWMLADANQDGVIDLVALVNGLTPDGNTALFDGIGMGINSLSQEPSPKAVIVFTDGLENNSCNPSYDSLTLVVTNAINAGVPVYTIGLGTDADQNTLQTIAGDTGGSFYFAPSAQDIASIYQQIGRQVRSGYVLRYHTHNPVFDGTIRTVTVHVTVGGQQQCGSGVYRVDYTPVVTLTPATLALSSNSQPQNVALTIAGTVVDMNTNATLQAEMFYEPAGTTSFTGVSMTLARTGPGNYSITGIIPAGAVITPGVFYYVWVSDGVEQVYVPFNYNALPLWIPVLPNLPPVIIHTPVTNATAGQAVAITAKVSDPDAGDYVSQVNLYYRVHDPYQSAPYLMLPMVAGAGANSNLFAVNIPANYVVGPGVDYFISAWDSHNSRSDHGSASVPHFIIVNPTRRFVQCVGTNAYAGSTLDVPIVMNSLRNENGLQFTLNYDVNLLSYLGADLGHAATNSGSLLEDTNSISQGAVGLEVDFLNSASNFGLGTQQVAVVHFAVASRTTPTNTMIYFSDDVFDRIVGSTNATELPVNQWIPGVVNILIGYEGDVAPRPYGDGQVTILDRTQLGRFIEGKDTPTPLEFQRADCAPFATGGDGKINVLDRTQVGRFIEGLDPLTLAWGPTGPVHVHTAAVALVQPRTNSQDSNRVVQAVNAGAVGGQVVNVPIRLTSQGNENGIQFSLSFDTNVLTFTGAALGAGATGGELLQNTTLLTNGQVGLAVDFPSSSQAFAKGTQVVAVASFVSAGFTHVTSTPVAFGDTPLAREVGSTLATELPVAQYIPGSVTLAVDTQPPSLTISGPAANQRLSNAVVAVQGRCADNARVASVWCGIKGGSWTQALLSASGTNWTASLPVLTPGTNIIQAYAVDATGNVSATNHGNFFYVLCAPLNLSIVGEGTVSPNYNNTLLAIGTNYTVTAKGTNGFGFVKWTDGAANTLTNNATLRFAMASNLTLIANFADVTPPTNSITAPVPGQRCSNAVFTAAGKAGDNQQVAQVRLKLNGADWTNATTANGWTNWSADMVLVPGTNTLLAYSLDSAGNHSATNRVSFDFVVTDLLQLHSVWLGVAPATYVRSTNSLPFEIGRNYGLLASNAPAGFVFTNWTIATNWVGGFTTNNPAVKFMMASNLTLTASYADITKPTLMITNLVSGAHLSNSVFAVLGKAQDNWGIEHVWLQFNSGTWTNPITVNEWTNWMTSIALNAGTNTLLAYAVDLAGNRSLTNRLSFIYTPHANAVALPAVSRAVVSGIPLQFESIAIVNGSLLLRLTGETGVTVVLDRSVDLTKWTPFQTNTMSSDGIQLSLPIDQAAQFFRARP